MSRRIANFPVKQIFYDILFNFILLFCSALGVLLLAVGLTGEVSLLILSFRLWEDGWKDRYYKNKFDVDADDIAFRHNVVSKLK